ncbi:hypothetical protein GCM10009539_86010 [Cryptosporangium japonicum]|uniref:Secreted protein n=1 Tax=Cryptosporangium japonicum TaxID=80872 RepID=A0ABN0VBT8_9ACTN
MTHLLAHLAPLVLRRLTVPVSRCFPPVAPSPPGGTHAAELLPRPGQLDQVELEGGLTLFGKSRTDPSVRGPTAAESSTISVVVRHCSAHATNQAEKATEPDRTLHGA